MRIVLMGRVVGLAQPLVDLRFESIQEQTAAVSPSLAERPLAERAGAAFLQCRSGEAPRCVASCVGCPRFVNWLPVPGGIRVRCLHCESDPVSSVMALAGASVQVHPQTAAEDAHQRARSAAVDHLLVVRSGQLVGVVDERTLAGAPPGVPVARCMSRRAWTVAGHTTLAEAAALMREQATDLLLVLEDDAVVGLVTQGDLRRVGVPPALAGEPAAGA